MSAMDHIVIVVRNKGLASNSNRATTRVDQTGKGKRTKLHWFLTMYTHQLSSQVVNPWQRLRKAAGNEVIKRIVTGIALAMLAPVQI